MVSGPTSRDSLAPADAQSVASATVFPVVFHVRAPHTQSVMRVWMTSGVMVLLAGCYVGSDASGEPQTDADSVAEASSSGGGSGSGGEGGQEPSSGDDGDPGPGPTAEHGSPGLRMLTQREFHNSVEDLLGVSVSLEDIPQEAIVEGHAHIASAQGVGLTDAERYYELGLEVGQSWSAGDTASCDPSSLVCAQEIATELLPRAYRRPLDAEELQRALAMLEDPEGGATTLERLETLIAATLSSPHFLYRSERGFEPVAGRPHALWLDDYEIAARLSFLVWQSGPDEALFAAAAAGELQDPQTRLVQLQRMLGDSKAARGQMGFVSDWLGTVGRSTVDDKDPEVLAGTSSALRASADESLRRTVAGALLDEGGRYSALLDADAYWMDTELAELLGADPVEEGFELRALDSSRRGLLLHPSVLAAHTKESGASPFTLGDFVAANILCLNFGPPAELPEFDPGENPDATLRERLETLTEPAECQACHRVIGPPGFAFLGFDPIGRYTPADGLGRPWDTKGQIPLGPGEVEFESAADLSSQLAAHEETARCIARRMYRWTYGYFESDAVEDDVEALEAASVDTNAEVRGVLESLVLSDAFAQVLRGE